MEAVLFWIMAAVAIISSLTMITRRQPVHSALAFLATLLSLAVLYLLLSAQFVAVMQIIIYAGAILVLFLFVIMLLHAQSGESPQLKLRFQGLFAVVLALALFGGLSYLLLNSSLAGAGELKPVPEGTVQAVGITLFNQFLLPFEVASVLLLIGVIGAVVLTVREDH
jgi:NADH-quinone oxidoreductase subunit J